MRATIFHNQRKLLERHIIGRQVHDLGSGDFVLSRLAIDLGARYVHAVDKRYKHGVLTGLPPRIRPVGEYFADYAKHNRALDVALISWPQQYAVDGLISLACVANTVIYIGSNFDGVSCGPTTLFRYLRTREVVAHLSHEVNSIIVYGKHLTGSRALLPEEYAGLYREKVYAYGSLSSLSVAAE